MVFLSHHRVLVHVALQTFKLLVTFRFQVWFVRLIRAQLTARGVDHINMLW
jgi:hypothetical protein